MDYTFIIIDQENLSVVPISEHDCSLGPRCAPPDAANLRIQPSVLRGARPSVSSSAQGSSLPYKYGMPWPADRCCPLFPTPAFFPPVSPLSSAVVCTRHLLLEGMFFFFFFGIVCIIFYGAHKIWGAVMHFLVEVFVLYIRIVAYS